MVSDCNRSRYPLECSRGGSLSPAMRRLLEVIEDLELRDFPFQGGQFT